MANEPNSDPHAPTPPPADPPPTDSSGTPAPPAEADPTAAPAVAKVAADPLSDGTVPTIINAGETHHSVPKGKASLTGIYHRADIITTLVTFVSILVALSIVGGLYYYFTSRGKPAATTPKVTTLNAADIEKLGSFFQGNAAGNSSEVLTISPSTLFKGRVAAASDLKVLGGAEVAGPTSLSDLTVNGTSTLGVGNIRGQLNVTGPTSLKGPVLMGAGGSISGNLSVTGTGSFGGSLSAGSLNVANLSVSGTFNLAGHLSMSGQNPSAAPASETGAGGSVNVDGNDASGTVDINTGTIAPQLPPTGGLLAKITFRNAYPRTPRVLISPIGQNGAAIQYYVLKTASGFTIGSNNQPNSNTVYSFDYWVVQ